MSIDDYRVSSLPKIAPAHVRGTAIAQDPSVIQVIVHPVVGDWGQGISSLSAYGGVSGKNVWSKTWQTASSFPHARGGQAHFRAEIRSSDGCNGNDHCAAKMGQSWKAFPLAQGTVPSLGVDQAFRLATTTAPRKSEAVRPVNASRRSVLLAEGIKAMA